MQLSFFRNLVAVVAGVSLAASASAQSPFGDLSGTGAVAYESQYVFRGKKITNSAFQPRAELGSSVLNGNGNLYGGIWSNQPISRRTSGVGPDQGNEVDVFAGFVYFFPGGLKVDVGNTYYWYPEAGGSSVPTPFSPTNRTDETYVGVTFNSAPYTYGQNLNPSVYYYHDWYLDSNTVEVSLKYVFDIPTNIIPIPGLSLVPQIVGGWTGAHRSWGDQIYTSTPGNPRPNWRNGYLYWSATMEVDYRLSDFCTLFVGASYAGNNDGKSGAPALIGGNPQLGGTQSNFWVGGGLKFSR